MEAEESDELDDGRDSGEDFSVRRILVGPGNMEQPQRVGGWEEAIQDRLKQLVAFFEEFEYLVKGHVTDFYVKDMWSSIPSDWRETFEKLSESDCIEMIERMSNPREVVQLLQVKGLKSCSSLLRFLGQISLLALDRKTKIRPSCGDRMRCGEGLARGMSPKKMHEVYTEGLHTGCCRLMLLRKGYLCRALSFKGSIDVIGIEQDPNNIQEAKRLDAQVRKELEFNLRRQDKGEDAASAQLASANIKYLQHQIKWREGGVVSALAGNLRHRASKEEDVEELNETSSMPAGKHRAIEEQEQEQEQEDGGGIRSSIDNFGLICLHACGDLVPNMLEYFVKTKGCCHLFAVSCCYMKVRCNGARRKEDEDEDAGQEGESFIKMRMDSNSENR
ncbi:hypothetical protein GUITHDRAFT_141250 [Guillardia theta CCMP2712]|uniref:Methyltransferase domain-containing protein n=1 Tax=Guillardia theta (strain CCMP2712) TaxID=905079 RepID=L1J198_GUITC|nr:hypothetical protein GUITHDRAFT_141250 [Guillardia theta CCMP2712]EKX42293.1 hypothetical protein GUITHDRAFT_141250 [Guillardia theta CCMP2712]|eukprot:XP_005829273.1 hypothetical protein GUITHDRAFT_141250 [Guillardia theta CCMP2712]